MDSDSDSDSLLVPSKNFCLDSFSEKWIPQWIRIRKWIRIHDACNSQKPQMDSILDSLQMDSDSFEMDSDSFQMDSD